MSSIKENGKGSLWRDNDGLPAETVAVPLKPWLTDAEHALIQSLPSQNAVRQAYEASDAKLRLSPTQAAVLLSMVKLETVATIQQLSANSFLRQVRGLPQSTQAAVGPTSSIELLPTDASARAVRLGWGDLKPVKNLVTNSASHAAGVATINLASGGTISGAIYPGDLLLFGNHANKYEVLTGNADVSTGGTIVLDRGLQTALPASAVTITVIRRGVFLRIVFNCENSVEGRVTSQNPSSQDCLLRLGEACMVRSSTTLSSVHATATASVSINSGRFSAMWGI